jgi:hypothetical protein
MANRIKERPHGTLSGYTKHFTHPDEYGPTCRSCKDAYNVWRRERRGTKKIEDYLGEVHLRSDKLKTEIISAYKYNTPCTDCKQWFHPAALDLDHIVPRTQTYASYGRSLARLPWEEFWKEMKIVEVVCASCHRLRTLERKSGVKPERSKRVGDAPLNG